MPKIFKSILKKKKTLFLFLGIVLFLSFLPSCFAKAGSCSDCRDNIYNVRACLKCYIQDPLEDMLSKLSSLASNIGNLWNVINNLPVIIIILMSILPIPIAVLVLSFLCGFITEILNALLYFNVNVPIKPTAATPVLQGAWTFTRDFSNMFLILALVIIGLGIILKLKEYEVKKALPKLILVALLINFTPVIVGFIVDMGNIVTKFFLDQAGKVEMRGLGLTYIENLVDDVIDLLFSGQEMWKVVAQFAMIAGQGIIMIIFFLMAIYIYWLVIFIFFMRVVYLWLLMVLSPIAFLSYAFPQSPITEKIFPSILGWKKWWEELINWSIFGIVFGFFLYLSNAVMASGIGYDFAVETGDFGDFLADGLQAIFALFILCRGYYISKDAAPAAAQAAITQIEKLGKTAIMAVATGGAGLAMGALAGGAAKRIGGASSWAKRMDMKAGEKGGGYKALRPLTKLTRWSTRGLERAAVPGLLKYEDEKTKIPKEFKNMTAGQKELYIQSQSRSRRMALSAAAGGQVAEMSPEFRQKLTEDMEHQVGNERHQKNIKTVTENVPEMMTEKMAIGLEIEGKKKELQEKINEKVKEIAKSVNLAEIDAEIRVKLNIEEGGEISKEQRIEFAKDTAAAAISIGKAKQSSIEKMTNPKSLAVRVGSHNWSPKTWQKFIGKFDTGVVNNVVEGPGGINRAVTDKSSFKKFCQKNPRLARSLIFNPAGQQVGWSGTQIAGGMSKGDLEKMIKSLSPEEKEETAGLAEDIVGPIP